MMPRWISGLLASKSPASTFGPIDLMTSLNSVVLMWMVSAYMYGSAMLQKHAISER